jgi:hypothetical protein
MKLYVVCFVIACVVLVVGLSIDFMVAEKPKTVVETFIQGAIKNDTGLLEKLVTNEPDYVYQRKLEQLEIISKGSTDSTPNPKPKGLVRSKQAPRLSVEQKLKSLIPMSLTENNRQLTLIVSVKEVGNEARVRVAMGNSELEDIEFDFLLFKEDNQWKIFQIQSVTSLQRDAYSFYAN